MPAKQHSRMMPDPITQETGANEQLLHAEIARLNMMIQALMDRAESSSSIGGSDFNLFQTAITLEDQIRQRTAELEAALHDNDKITRALRESENHNRLLIENSPMCIHEIDMSGKVTSMNRAGLNMLGLADECEVQGYFYLDAVNAVDRERIGTLLTRAYAGETSHFEFKASGSAEKIYKSCFVPIKNKNGIVQKLMGITEDITERKQAQKNLAMREYEFRTLTENSPDNIARYDCGGRILYINPALELVLGRTSAELVGRTPGEIAPGNSFERYQKSLLHVGATGESISIEQIISSGDARPRIHSILMVAEKGTDGSPIGVLAVGRDISEIKLAEENLRIIASVFGNSQEGIVITDANNIFVDVNPAFTQITGYTREEVIGKDPKILSSGRQDKAFYAGMWQSLKQKRAWRGEIWNRRKSGEVYAELLSIAAICGDDDRVQRYVGVFSDISYIKAHEIELNQVANYDALTGIPNRRLLVDRLDQAIARSRRSGKILSVSYIDLDGFKQVNDQYGHEAGDQLLVAISGRLQESLRAGDTLARLGGDEFVVLFNDLADEKECYLILDRILEIVATPVSIDSNTVSVSASIGVTFYRTDGANGDTLLRQADQAMYVAKQSGKSQYHLHVSGEAQ